MGHGKRKKRVRHADRVKGERGSGKNRWTDKALKGWMPYKFGVQVGSNVSMYLSV
jgi:hypothetical protein